MRHMRHFLTDDGQVLLEEHTLAYGDESDATELAISVGRRVRVELLDDGGHLLDGRTYLVAPTTWRTQTR